MTDNEIIKALECCKTGDDCKGCPYCVNGLYTCGEHFNEDMLDLINRQKAEIENMNNLVVYNATCATKLQLKLVEAKAEAVKEFAERLKEKAVDVGICDAQGNGYGGATVILIGDIDNLVKEMVGET